MDRSVHLVGTVPGDNAWDAMRAILDVPGLARHLRTLPDGETGPRQWWVKAELDAMLDIPGLVIVNPDAGFTSPDDAISFEVPAGYALRAEDLERRLPTLTAFQASYPLFRRLREERGLPRLSFQVGLPSPPDLALLAFRREAGLRPDIYEPVLEAKTRLIRACAALAAGDVAFQLDVPIPLIMVATAPADQREKVAHWAAGLIAEVPARTEPGTRFGVHLCVGDMHHKPMVRPDSAEPAVLLANEIASQWPQGWPLEWVHIPFAAAEDPPPPDESWYRPLQDLTLGAATRFAAGFVHEKLAASEHRRLLAVIERNAGPADISMACGLGRRPESWQVRHALQMCATLAAA